MPPVVASGAALSAARHGRHAFSSLSKYIDWLAVAHSPQYGPSVPGLHPVKAASSQAEPLHPTQAEPSRLPGQRRTSVVMEEALGKSEARQYPRWSGRCSNVEPGAEQFAPTGQVTHVRLLPWEDVAK